MKDQDMSLKELHEAYDLTEKQQRKFLVKTTRHWLKQSKDEQINKIINKNLEIVEKYIRGEAAKEELLLVYHEASSSYDLNIAGASRLSECATLDNSDLAFAVSCYCRTNHSYCASDYKELLLEVINEMDEFERTIRRKI